MNDAREAFEAAGFSTAGLSDQQVRMAAERLVAEHGDHIPRDTDIDRALGSVRFQDRLEQVKVSVKATIECNGCVPFIMPYPSGKWIVHSKRCAIDPGGKIRRVGHPANGKKRLAETHRAEDIRSTIVPIRQQRSCDHCGAVTFERYCRECGTVRAIVRNDYADR